MGQMTIRRQVQRESEQTLARAGVDVPSEVVLPEKKPPCTIGPQVEERVKLTTNMWGLTQNKVRIYKYDVEFRGVLVLGGGQTRRVKFVKGSVDNVVMLDLKDKNLAVFKGLLTRHRAAFDGPVFCDLQSAVYTTTELPLEQFRVDDSRNRREMRVFDDIRLHDIDPPGLFQENYESFEVAFKRVHERFDLELDNFARLKTNNLTEVDRSLLQFLELATSHHVLMNPQDHVVFPGGVSYHMTPQEHGFSPEDMLIVNGRNMLDPDNALLYLAVGVHKSVRFVSARSGKGACALIVETKKSPFHMPGPLLDKVKTHARTASVDDIAGNDVTLTVLTSKFRGKYVIAVPTAQYNPQGGQSLLKLKRFVSDTSQSYYFDFQGRNTSLFDYYRVKYGYVIRHPNAPLALVTVGGRNVHYPIELLAVADNQRIGVADVDPTITSNMIRACAIEPQKLDAQNRKNLAALHLDNPDIQGLGVAAHGPIELDGVVHSSPKLRYGNMDVAVQQGKWRTGNTKYITPADNHMWAVVYVGGGDRDNFSQDDFRKFVKVFRDLAAAKGMRLGDPLQDHVQAKDTAFKAKMAELAGRKIEYILFAHTESDKFIHDLMKWAETHYGFATQDTKLKTCRDVIKGKPQTLENIVNKANIKLGGLNYTFNRNDPTVQEIFKDVLYIGFGANHPGGGLGMDSDSASGGIGNGNGNGSGGKNRHTGPPTVVGFSANCSQDPFQFVGDFMFQEARRDEKVSVVETIVERCLQEYVKNCKKLPKRVVLFRNGCAEGQFANILMYEVPLIRHVLHKIATQFGGEAARLTVTVPSRKHNVRFFMASVPPGSGPLRNVKPGTVIDHTVTSHNGWEFYLNAHTAFQGTAKVPRYTVLLDENNISSENLQRLVYWLCHGHQIVALTTSLPAPVYIANEYAKRGRNIYKSVTTLGDSTNHGTAAGDRYKQMSPEQLNETLTYWTGAGGLRMDFRVNA